MDDFFKSKMIHLDGFYLSQLPSSLSMGLVYFKLLSIIPKKLFGQIPIRWKKEFTFHPAIVWQQRTATINWLDSYLLDGAYYGRSYEIDYIKRWFIAKNVYFWFHLISFWSCSHQSWSLSSCRTWTFCLHQKLTLHTIFKSGCQSPRHPLKVRRVSKS